MNLAAIWDFIKSIIKTYNLSTPNGEKIYKMAVSRLGVDASPNDLAPDELGCAETVTQIIKDAGFNQLILVSTAKLNEYLVNESMWLKVETPIRGDIIISPTGMGGPKIKVGHVGIMADSYKIMSNSSSDGKFKQNYNLDTWKKRWFEYPCYFYRRMGA